MSQDRTTGDEMRHIPPLQTVVDRVGNIYRHRVDVALDVLHSGGVAAESAKELERTIHSAAQWLERTADLARRTRHPAKHDHHDAHARLKAAVAGAAEALEHLNAAEFRVRAPYHKFDISPAEAIWESVLAAGYAIGRLCETLAANDRDLWWRIYDQSPKETTTLPLIVDP